MKIGRVLQHRRLRLQSFISGVANGVLSQPLAQAHDSVLPHLPHPAGLGAVGHGNEIALANPHPKHKVMPLRVLWVLDGEMQSSGTRRLLISGRMADVCAELDRMVAREATLH